MKNFIKQIIAGLSLMLVFVCQAFAQDNNKPAVDTMMRKADSLQSELARARIKVKPYKDVVTGDFVTTRGLFIVHKNKTKDQWLFEIPDSLLNRDILAVTRLAKTQAGSEYYPGEEQDERAIRFEFGPDSILDMRNNLVVMHADSNSQIAKVVKKSDNNPIVASFQVLAYGPGKKTVVVDVTRFITGMPYSFINANSKNTRLGKLLAAIKKIDILYVHAYPQNVDIRTRKQGPEYTGTDGDITGDPATVETVTSFVALPKTPMSPRYTDDRVGYFSGYYLTFADNQQRTEIDHYIGRWRLEPKPEDLARWKSGKLVEPKKPIVIYIDPATPKQWRPYLIAGINDWQKAFEQAGFKNAIIGKEWPENDPNMHMDDARYSMINYLPSEVANAYGPQTLDPRSGEVISTRIGWYHNLMTVLRNWYMTQAGALDPEARYPKFNTKLMGNLIRFVSSHEVGHTLGLQHNFLSSSFTPVDSLRSQRYLKKHGHTISIMDYARFNYVAQPEDHIKQEQLWPHIGEYDKWAIEWGYRPTQATDPYAAKLELSKLTTARLNKQPKLLWLNAQQTAEGKQDPRATSEDLGDDAAKASSYGIKNLKRVLSNLPAWTREDAGDGSVLKSAFKEVQTEYVRFMKHVVQNLYGSYYTPKSEEQAGNVFGPVPKAKQMAALDFLDKELFTTPTWLLNKEVNDRLVVPDQIDFVNDVQVTVLNTLLSAQLIDTKLAQVTSFGTDAFPLELYFSTIHKSIWREVQAGQSVTDVYRRNLQRSYLACLKEVITSAEQGNVRTERSAYVRAEARKLQQEIKQALPKVSDKATLDHLHDLSDRLDDLFKHTDLITS